MDSNLGNYGWSVLRTVVPGVVGALVGWLVARAVIAPEDAPQVVAAVVVVVQGAWYALARWLEPRVSPWVTTAMGLVGRPPTYA